MMAYSPFGLDLETRETALIAGASVSQSPTVTIIAVT